MSRMTPVLTSRSRIVVLRGMSATMEPMMSNAMMITRDRMESNIVLVRYVRHDAGQH